MGNELAYLSKTPGIGGKLKDKPEDFIVEEIGEDGTVFELSKRIERAAGCKRFTHFILQKKDWSTTDAIKTIAGQLHVSHTRFNFAGTKDKRAITTQLASVLGVEPERILSIRIKDISINGAWGAPEKVEMGALAGNRFEIRVEGGAEDGKKITKIYKELDGKFPNYFGEQRFGSTRRNTHIVGEKILRGDFESAAMDYLTNSEGEENETSKMARKELAEGMDFAGALKTFPAYLRMERMMIEHLAKQPKDYTGAFRKLPRNILLLFIHAFQSHIFNEVASGKVKRKCFAPEEGEYYCGKNKYGFPDIGKREEKKGNNFVAAKIVGYETVELNETEYEMLEKYKLKPSSFKLKEIPEVSSKGTYRTVLSPFKDFEFDGGLFRFSIPAGSYATSALREFIDVDKT